MSDLPTIRSTRDAAPQAGSAASPLRARLARAVARGPLGRALRIVAHGDATVFTLGRLTGPGATPPALLRATLAHLRRYRYPLLPLAALMEGAAGERPLPASAVAFAVDGSYADFVAVGQPLFERFDCPVTLFVTTGPLDGGGWLWHDAVAWAFRMSRARRLHVTRGPVTLSAEWATPAERDASAAAVCAALRDMTTGARESFVRAVLGALEVVLPTHPTGAYASLSWSDVRRAEAGGLVTVGARTVTAPLLARCDDQRSRWEIAESLRRCRRECAGPIALFAYPGGHPGDFGPRETATVADRDVRWAFTARAAHVGRRALRDGTIDPYAVPRRPFPASVAAAARTVSGVGRLLRG